MFVVLLKCMCCDNDGVIVDVCVGVMMWLTCVCVFNCVFSVVCDVVVFVLITLWLVVRVLLFMCRFILLLLM